MNHKEKSKETYSVVKAMEDALVAGSNDMSKYFHEEFRWMGNQGCGTKKTLKSFEIIGSYLSELLSLTEYTKQISS